MILVTGATGLLGMSLVARLLEDDDGPDILLPVRARDAAHARGRMRTMLALLYDTPPDAAARLRPLPGDVTQRDLGLAAADVRGVRRVVHCAASISFTLPLAEARAINVGGTANVLDLCRRLPALERLVHVSTAYVAGRHHGRFGEADLDLGQSFRNTYEQTKWEAEQLVQSAGLPAVIVRPSIVVGESDSGWTSAFNVIYWPLQAFARGLVDEIAADPRGLVDLVPVDHVTRVLHHATTAANVSGTMHAVAGDHACRVSDLVTAASSLLGRPTPRFLVPGAHGDRPGAEFAPYFDIAVAFDDHRAREQTSGLDASAEEILRAILDYARRTRWGKRPLTRQAARAHLAAAN